MAHEGKSNNLRLQGPIVRHVLTHLTAVAAFLFGAILRKVTGFKAIVLSLTNLYAALCVFMGHLEPIIENAQVLFQAESRTRQFLVLHINISVQLTSLVDEDQLIVIL